MAVLTARRRVRGPEAAEARLAFWLILPAVVGLLAISAYPVIQTMLWSFQHYILTYPENVYFNARVPQLELARVPRVRPGGVGRVQADSVESAASRWKKRGGSSRARTRKIVRWEAVVSVRC